MEFVLVGVAFSVLLVAVVLAVVGAKVGRALERIVQLLENDRPKKD